MSWPEIKVEDLPLVLAGPILRKVSPTSVSVWLALKSEASVFLTVKDASDNPVAFTDPIGTLRVGANLHLAFLTAVPEENALVPGVVYRYSVGFTVGSKSYTLDSATNKASLAYPTQPYLPSFCLRRRWTSCASSRAPAGSHMARVPMR